MNKKAGIPWKEAKQRLIDTDPELADELEAIAPEYEIACQLIKARLELGMTQKELAIKIGTRQSNISRIERGQQNISIELLNKVAKGLDKNLKVLIR